MKADEREWESNVSLVAERWAPLFFNFGGTDVLEFDLDEDNDAPSANYRRKRAANWPEDVDFAGTGARRHAPLDRSATLVGGRQ